jgi:hypothetical protein
LRSARVMWGLEKLPRRPGFACPSCKTAPLLGARWKCSQCGQAFDTFATGAVCPNCAAQYPVTGCGFCGEKHPMSEWVVGGPASSGVINGGFLNR